MEREYILLFSGTRVLGVVFLNHCLSLSVLSRLYLTIYVRSTAKLPSSVKTSLILVKVRVVVGELDSSS